MKPQQLWNVLIYFKETLKEFEPGPSIDAVAYNTLMQDINELIRLMEHEEI